MLLARMVQLLSVRMALTAILPIVREPVHAMVVLGSGIDPQVNSVGEVQAETSPAILSTKTAPRRHDVNRCLGGAD